MKLSSFLKNRPFLILLAAAALSGCGSAPAPCRPGSGSFCYQGIDFGANPDPLYRQGVRDGCQTGKGDFRKDYRLSGSSPTYRQGWDRGRTLCRPAGWSDSPTYSYHPAPSRTEESDYVTAEERIRRYANEE
jgi:hypothetical protein